MNLYSSRLMMLSIWLIVTVVLHEIGHYMIAKHQKNYIGWGIWWGSIVIKMKRKSNSRWDYLGGFACGLLGMPLGLIFGLRLKFMVIVQLFLSLLDFILLIFYDWDDWISKRKW